MLSLSLQILAQSHRTEKHQEHFPAAPADADKVGARRRGSFRKWTGAGNGHANGSLDVEHEPNFDEPPIKRASASSTPRSTRQVQESCLQPHEN